MHTAACPPIPRAKRRSAHRAFAHFAAGLEEPLTASAAMLRAWLIDGIRQERLAEACGLTDRQIRTHLGRAADVLATWLAERVGRSVQEIRALFSHLSTDKRARALHLLALAG